MSESTAWWTMPWNPTVGCTPASPECDHCWARTLHERRRAAEWVNKPAQYKKPFSTLQTFQNRLGDPLHWRKPHRVFVTNMGDLCHNDVPSAFIAAVFKVMRVMQKHRFLVLTKRIERLVSLLRDPAWTQTTEGGLPSPWPPQNIWIGTTAGNDRWYEKRVRQSLAKFSWPHRFLSYEPALGPIAWDRTLTCLDWVIAGPETGRGARPSNDRWFVDARDYCRTAHVPFYLKGWIGSETSREIPDDLIMDWERDENNKGMEQPVLAGNVAGRNVDQALLEG